MHLKRLDAMILRMLHRCRSALFTSIHAMMQSRRSVAAKRKFDSDVTLNSIARLREAGLIRMHADTDYCGRTFFLYSLTKSGARLAIKDANLESTRHMRN